MAIDYLRISLTDRCNLRCFYCMPSEGIVNKPQEDILTFEEILRLVKILTSFGITKVRLTGGEPLVRNGVIGFTDSLSKIAEIKEVFLTTNGLLLADYAKQLKKAGVKGINISLDTLREEKFKQITRGNSFAKVIEGIKNAKEANFSGLKLNVVVMKGINDDEIIDFVKFAQEEKLILRFIEFMKITPLWNEDYFFPIEEVRKICQKNFSLQKTDFRTNGPAGYYSLANTMIGFINTNQNNCSVCSRLRLTSTGQLKICLYEDEGLCLRTLLRDGASDGEIKDALKNKIGIKSCVSFKDFESEKLYMCSIGG